VIQAVLFDWGNTVMVDDGRYKGPMCQWPRVQSCTHVRGALRTLSERYTIALATNADDSHEKEIREALKRVHLNSRIELVFCSNDIGARKPSLEFYNHIAGALSLPPREIVMVGDSLQNDVYGAVRAGLHALWYAPTVVCGATECPVRSFKDFRELPRLMEETERGRVRQG
jgi:HAD superfamily hydrolase (TIGR01662 family)